jgi:hypothetical protein
VNFSYTDLGANLLDAAGSVIRFSNSIGLLRFLGFFLKAINCVLKVLCQSENFKLGDGLVMRAMSWDDQCEALAGTWAPHQMMRSEHDKAYIYHIFPCAASLQKSFPIVLLPVGTNYSP